MESIIKNLPGGLGRSISHLPAEILKNIEEIRIKAEKPVFIYANGKEYYIEGPFGTADKNTLNLIFNNLLKHSFFAFQDEIAKGYVTLEGGHRVGICGRTVIENGMIKTIKDISSINIRRSREVLGVSDFCLPFLLKAKGELYNTIIVSPPKCGKTTLLRDIIRNVSNRGFIVGLCDERSEVAGSYQGVSPYDLGTRTDILDGCPKHEGMMMLIRSMSPHIIATDEIGKVIDCQALEAAMYAGISLLTTIHGKSYDDLIKSGIGEIVKNGCFERFIYLSNEPKVGSISKICDSKGESIWPLS